MHIETEELAKKYPEERSKYTAGKSFFIQEVIALAKLDKAKE